jgi:hypothetical protein
MGLVVLVWWMFEAFSNLLCQRTEMTEMVQAIDACSMLNRTIWMYFLRLENL